MIPPLMSLTHIYAWIVEVVCDRSEKLNTSTFHRPGWID